MQIQYTKNFNPSLLLTTILKAISCNRSTLGLLETLQKCQAVPQYVRCGKIAGLNNCNLARAGKRFFSLLSTPICWLVFLQSSPIWLLEFITESIFTPNAPINVNPVAGGGGVRAKGGDLMPETIPLSGFWSCEATPGSGHLTFTDRSLVSIQKRLPSPSLLKQIAKTIISICLLSSKSCAFTSP